MGFSENLGYLQQLFADPQIKGDFVYLQLMKDVASDA